ncbi:MAG: ATP-binding protein [Roseibium sp.]|nr:ATP-binding protein [Roseibium sp.]
MGPNGSGKSSLMHHIYSQSPQSSRRISAHRQIWFESNSLDLTPKRKEELEQQYKGQDNNISSRWKDWNAAQRSQIAIFDLVDAESISNQKIADAMRAGNTDEAQKLACSQSPLELLNSIFRVSNLPIKISIGNGSSLVATIGDGTPFSIAELSDGERNALLIVATVLTAPMHQLMIIDEPERHLHRSIVSPLITSLMSHRPDCAFVVSTHDISLLLDQENTSALLIRTYQHDPKVWDADFVAKVGDIDGTLAHSILGARRKILFVEGVAGSLDNQLYQILFPDVSVTPLGSCVSVERAVRGIRGTEALHWISAYGLIDSDQRSEDNISALADSCVVALPFYSVEALYYHPKVFEMEAANISKVEELDVPSAIQTAREEALKAIEGNVEQLAAKVAERKVRDSLMSNAPSWKEIGPEVAPIKIDIVEIFEFEKSKITELLRSDDLNAILASYPLRKTPALSAMARALNRKKRTSYEGAVRKLLTDNKEAREILLDELRPLANLIGDGEDQDSELPTAIDAAS